jgi:hypothetical protein
MIRDFSMSRKGPPVRARNRIACFNFERMLPAFEEHEEERNKVWGQHECLDCGGRHDIPCLGLSLVCPELSADEGKILVAETVPGARAQAASNLPNWRETPCEPADVPELIRVAGPYRYSETGRAQRKERAERDFR